MIELTKPLADAIIEFDDIAYSESLGPKNDEAIEAWNRLLKLAENVAGRKAYGTRAKVTR